ncbi:hypothetical protein [Bizionia arctica]|uniref:Lipoprotein n=1 Tax=Bizionia arctica TaxID=1495645 RepID=A0A917LKV9_9FLAO|nr:hypothetical protein [Bizionia arctica]GGG37390.1 hypothetical protein GCM10010976_06360 [Bizionia arctica]
MKNIIIFGLLLIISACSSSKVSSTNSPHVTNTNCPEDGVCTFEVFHKKTLNIKKDGIGALYPELTEGKNIVIKFEYKRNEIPYTADGGYSEIIYAEIDASKKEINLNNEGLLEAKMVYGRICFCRGETGYYPIKKGDFKVSTNKDGTTTYDLTFKIQEVPQIITSFHETL